jgi:hypothetical protein
MSTLPPTPPVEESERRVKRGCLMIFILLLSSTAVFAVEYGMNLLTILFAVLLVFTTIMLVVLFRPQAKK